MAAPIAELQVTSGHWRQAACGTRFTATYYIRGEGEGGGVAGGGMVAKDYTPGINIKHTARHSIGSAALPRVSCAASVELHEPRNWN